MDNEIDQYYERRTKELNTLLDSIDSFLEQEDTASIQLWRILTALRGPDSGDEDLKDTTTAIIRSAAFPKTAEKYLNTGLSIGAVFSHLPLERFDIDRTDQNLSYHFCSHADTAHQALKALNRDPMQKEEPKQQ